MNQIQSFLERPKVYANIDGMGELSIGVMCLAYALFAWFYSHASPSSSLHQGYTWLIYLAVMLAILHYGSQAIKNRITYRRTGFVAYRPRDKYWVPVGIAIAVSGLLWAMERQYMSTPLSLIGLVFAASYICIARTVRWKWAVFWATVIGSFVIATLPTEFVEAVVNHTTTPALPARTAGVWWLTFVLYGALLIISGGTSFWLYLHHTQPPAQAAQ